MDRAEYIFMKLAGMPGIKLMGEGLEEGAKLVEGTKVLKGAKKVKKAAEEVETTKKIVDRVNPTNFETSVGGAPANGGGPGSVSKRAPKQVVQPQAPAAPVVAKDANTGKATSVDFGGNPVNPSKSKKTAPVVAAENKGGGRGKTKQVGFRATDVDGKPTPVDYGGNKQPKKGPTVVKQTDVKPEAPAAPKVKKTAKSPKVDKTTSKGPKVDKTQTPDVKPGADKADSWWKRHSGKIKTFYRDHPYQAAGATGAAALGTYAVTRALGSND